MSAEIIIAIQTRGCGEREVPNLPAVFSEQSPAITADFCHGFYSRRFFTRNRKLVVEFFTREVSPHGEFMIIKRESGLAIRNIVFGFDVLRGIAVQVVFRASLLIVEVVARRDRIFSIPTAMAERDRIAIKGPHPRRFITIFLLFTRHHIQVKKVGFVCRKTDGHIERFTIVFAEIVIPFVIATIEPVGGDAHTEHVGHNWPHSE
ncbi:hypothetical protein D3C75_581760 [compost metagenome]